MATRNARCKNAFVDLSAAYDTVNHRLLIQKLYNIMQDSALCRVIQNLLSNRRFYVKLNNYEADGDYRRMAYPKTLTTVHLFGVIISKPFPNFKKKQFEQLHIVITLPIQSPYLKVLESYSSCYF